MLSPRGRDRLSTVEVSETSRASPAERTSERHTVTTPRSKTRPRFHCTARGSGGAAVVAAAEEAAAAVGGNSPGGAARPGGGAADTRAKPGVKRTLAERRELKRQKREERARSKRAREEKRHAKLLDRRSKGVRASH